MGNSFIALFLDVIVLMFLAATIFYVLRLTKNLNNFKTQRKELDSVVTSLLSSIDQAERSITSLKQISAKEAADLEQLIKRSGAMADELKIINDAGESMAKRLEKLAETNREIAQSSQAMGGRRFASSKRSPARDEKISSPVHDKRKNYSSTLKNVDRRPSEEDDAKDLPSFMIRDPEYSEDMDENDLSSQAEKDLYDALKSGKHNISSKGKKS